MKMSWMKKKRGIKNFVGNSFVLFAHCSNGTFAVVITFSAICTQICIASRCSGSLDATCIAHYIVVRLFDFEWALEMPIMQTSKRFNFTTFLQMDRLCVMGN